MKTIASLFVTLALATTAFAGTESYSSKSTKAVVPPVVPTGCDCFGPGLSLGLFGAGILPDEGGDDELGGGVLAEYFFNPYIGVQGSYGIFATEKEHHEFDTALVLRYPITSICVAPYVFGGVGYSTNSNDAWNYFVGAGLEARFSEASCFGVFADGAYHFAEDDSDSDFTIVRVGVKFSL